MRVYTGAEWVAAYVSLGSVLLTANGLADLLDPAKGLANLHGYATTVKSNSTTTLTAASAVYQRFTGSSAQSVVLPNAGTLQLGSFFELHNNDTTGSLTVKSADGSTIMTALAGQIVRLVCVLASGSTAASWKFAVCGFPGVTGSGNAVLNTDPIITNPNLINPALSTQSTLVAGTAAQGQGLITGDLVVVITTAANPSGVTLPTALEGRWITVVNRGTNPINVYPALGAAIDAGAANAPVQIAVGAGATFSASSTTLWLSDMNATQAEAAAGTDNTRALTPLGLRQGLNASGDAPIYACRAWVNFNGVGTVAIHSSGNVASITDNGIGNYTVNFATAMPHENYCAQVTSVPKGTGNNINHGFGLYPGGTKTVLAVQVAVGGASNAFGFTVDFDQVNVAIFC